MIHALDADLSPVIPHGAGRKTSELDAANLLDGAVKYMANPALGWRQGSLGLHGEPRCAHGALFSSALLAHRIDLGDRWACASGETYSYARYLALTAVCDELRSTGHELLTDFNDNDRTSLYDVVCVFEQAALKLRKHHEEATP